MDIVILGGGNVGFRLAKQLIEEDKNVVLIEKDPERAKNVSNQLDCLVINEVGNNLDTLKKAGIEKADYFICVTDSDEINMIACGLVSSEFRVPNKIARIRNIDYSGARVIEHPFLGIDFFVNPEIEASKAIIRAIEQGVVSDVVFFEKGGLQMRSITVSATSIFSDKSIKEIKNTVEATFLVAVVLRENYYFIPHGDSVVRENDTLYLIATEENFEIIFSKAGKNRMTVNKIVIIGGGTVGQNVAEHFLYGQKKLFPVFNRLLRYFKFDRKKKINIIDTDYETCKLLAAKFPEALVINGDISDEGFTDEERLSDADLVIAATDNQELNIVNAVYAKSIGAKRTIVLVNKSSFVHAASKLGIDITISPIDSMVSTILKHIRKSNIRSVHSISGGKMEVIELSVVETSSVVAKQIRDIKLPAHTLILSVTRGETDIIPDGEVALQSGDYVIVIARKESVPKVEELFAG